MEIILGWIELNENLLKINKDEYGMERK